jgi:predicted porin
MASSLEARFEKGLNRNQTSWLSRSSIGYDANPAWRVLGRLNFAISDADNNSLLNAGFVEGVVGIAYRPVTNNRVNALVKYTYFQDTATYGQLTAAGTTAAPKQRSQILSADVTYKLTNWLSLGGKYGFRFGEVALSRSSDVFLSSKAHLAIVRADFHIVKKWDALVEARYLGVKQAGDSRTGVLVGLYRHLGDHAKVGVGYSFSEFSDDLTNLEYRSKGLFLNVIGKF